MNSEGFRETFLRNGRKTQGAKTAGKKDAKQKASPCDRTEKIKRRSRVPGNEECSQREQAENGPENTASAAARTSRS